MINESKEEREKAIKWYNNELKNPIHDYDTIDAMNNIEKHAMGDIILNKYYAVQVIKLLKQHGLWRVNH